MKSAAVVSLFLIHEIWSKAFPISYGFMANANRNETVPECSSLNATDCQPNEGKHRKKKQMLDFKACMLATLRVQNQDFEVNIDTGSSDTVLPYRQLNDYYGYPSITTYSSSGGQLFGLYGDKSWWRGYVTYFNVSLKGTDISGFAPIIVATSQNTPKESYAGQFMDGILSEGLMGLGYPTLALGGDTVVHSWFKDGAISKYQIAFHGCSPDKTENSWIDIGNDTPYKNPLLECQQNSTQVSIPDDGTGYYSLDIISMAINEKKINLPSSWQDYHFSLLDSCTTQVFLPSNVFSSLVASILSSGGFSKALANDRYLPKYFDGSMGYYISSAEYTSNDIIWSKLPTISITIRSSTASSTTLILTPKQYLMYIDYIGGWFFFITSSDDSYAILGYPFFASYFIVADLENRFLNFQPGCGCSGNESQIASNKPHDTTVSESAGHLSFPGSAISLLSVLISCIFS